jgi:hypothetical protein
MKNQWILSFMSLTLVIHGLAFASSTSNTRSILQGLHGVEIFVEDIDISLASAGLSTEQLHTEITHRLHHVGIRILTKDEAAATPGLPVLYVYVKTAKHPSNIYAFYIEVSLREIVRLERNELLFIDAPSWSENELGIVGHKEIRKLRDKIHDIVEKFIVTYQLTNPHLLVAAKDSLPAYFSFEDRIREVQHRLKEAGFAPGPIDGKFGRMTKRALRQFQLANQIPTTGNLDEVTQKALGISMGTSSDK